jgi:hypothetical protein
MSEAGAPAARRLFQSQSASYLLNPVFCFRRHVSVLDVEVKCEAGWQAAQIGQLLSAK